MAPSCASTPAIDKGFTVANSRSARKRIRVNERKHIRNRTVRSAVRTKIGRVRRSLVLGQTADIEVDLKAALKALDKAAEKGILHRRNAARRKSRIATLAARLLAVSGSAEEQAVVRAAAGGAKGRTTKAASTKAASTAKPAAVRATAAKPKVAATSPAKKTPRAPKAT
jgi:small subunit ribosomal protein S20